MEPVKARLMKADASKADIETQPQPHRAALGRVAVRRSGEGLIPYKRPRRWTLGEARLVTVRG